MKWLANVLIAWSPAFSQTEPGPQLKPTPADVAQGERTYGTECSFCHGPKGEGAVGPALAVPRLLRAPNDQALFQVIREGVAGTQMPPSTLTDRPDLAISGLCANARAHTAVEVDWRCEAWRANLCWKGRLREVSHPRRPWRRHWTRSERRWRPKGQGLLARIASHSGSLDSSRLHASPVGHQRRTTFGGSALK